MNTEKATRKPRPRTPVTLIVEREFVGDKTIPEAMIPVILEDLRRKTAQVRTFDKRPDSA
jgi:hypothetical protein